MQRKIIEFTYEWADKLNVNVKSIKFRKYRRGLAKASQSKGEIYYHKRISKILTRKQQYYVALHEVAHLITPRVHSKEWKVIMDKYMPNWRELNKKIGKAVWKNKYYNRRLK